MRRQNRATCTGGKIKPCRIPLYLGYGSKHVRCRRRRRRRRGRRRTRKGSKRAAAHNSCAVLQFGRRRGRVRMGIEHEKLAVDGDRRADCAFVSSGAANCSIHTGVQEQQYCVKKSATCAWRDSGEAEEYLLCEHRCYCTLYTSQRLVRSIGNEGGWKNQRIDVRQSWMATYDQKPAGCAQSGSCANMRVCPPEEKKTQKSEHHNGTRSEIKATRCTTMVCFRFGTDVAA